MHFYSFNYKGKIRIMANENNNIQATTDDSQIVLYQPNESVKLEVKVDAGHETVWLTQQQIADLFGTKRPAITKHLSNIYASGELDKNSTCSILEHMGNDGKQRYATTYYNLDAIISVGYRIVSMRQLSVVGQQIFCANTFSKDIP